jgi:hypothetical protein
MSQPFSSLLTLLIPCLADHGRQVSQLPPGIFPVRTGTGGLRLAASEGDDLRLQHQPEYFNKGLLGLINGRKASEIY